MYHESSLGGDRYYSPKHSVLHEDDLLTIKASGWENGEAHWTSFLSVAPSEPDYDFWYWLVRIRQASELVEERNLAKWKAEYAASQSRGVEVTH